MRTEVTPAKAALETTQLTLSSFIRCHKHLLRSTLPFETLGFALRQTAFAYATSELELDLAGRFAASVAIGSLVQGILLQSYFNRSVLNHMDGSLLLNKAQFK